jgi:transcriptional regulator with XRE-family HTH domain
LATPEFLTLPAGDEQSLGVALADYRRRHGKTLQDIAEMTGISIGTLSKIENAKAAPSFNTLRRILQSLDLGGPAREPAAEPRPAPPAGRRTATLTGETFKHVTGHAILHLHATDLLNKDMFPMTAQITLHQAPPIEEWTTHDGEEFVCVVRGAVTVNVENYKPVTLREGESAYFDSGLRHVIVSDSTEDATIVSVSTGRQDHGATDGLPL